MDIIETIKLDKNASDKDFKLLCETAKQYECFKACGSPDDMWIKVRFKNDKSKKEFYQLLER